MVLSQAVRGHEPDRPGGATGDLAPKAFPRSRLRYAEPTEWLNTTRPEMTPVGATPETLLFIGWLLLGWLALTIGVVLFLLFDFARGSALTRPFKVVWLLNALFFGPLALLAYWLSDRRSGRLADMSQWRRALGPAIYSVIAPLIGTALGLYLYSVHRPNTQMSSGYMLSILAGSFLLNWLLFQALLWARARDERYWTSLRRSVLATFVATVLAMLALLATGQLFSAWWFRDMPLAKPAVRPLQVRANRFAESDAGMRPLTWQLEIGHRAKQ